MDKTPLCWEEREQEPWGEATTPPDPEVAEYLRDLAGTPALTDAREQALVADLRSAAGDRQPDIRRLLIEGTLARAVELARSYQGQGVALADLIGIANLALVKAAQAFDPAPTARLFRPVAVQRMRREIKDHLKAVARYKWAGEGSDEDGEADEGWPLSLDAPPPGRTCGAQDQEQEGGTLRDLLAASLLYEEAAYDYDWAQSLRLRQGVDLLPQRARQVLELRYRLLGEAGADTRPRSLREVGHTLGVSKELVRQRQARGIRFLRVYFASLGKRTPASGGPPAPPRASAAGGATTTRPPTAPGPSPAERKAPAPPPAARPAPNPRPGPAIPPPEPALFRPPGSGQRGEGPGPAPHVAREPAPTTTYGFARSRTNGWTENLASPPVPRSIQVGTGGLGKSTLLKSLLADELLNMRPGPPSDPVRQAPTPFAFHADDIADLAFSPGGEQLALVDRAGAAWVYDVARGGRPRQRGPEVGEGFTRVCWSPSGAHLAAAGARSRAIWAWDARSGETSVRRSASRRPPIWMCWSPGGLRFGSADETSVHIWPSPPLRDEPVSLVITPRWSTPTRLAWSPDGRCLAAATLPRPPLSWLLRAGSSSIHIWDTFTGEERLAFPLGGSPLDLA